VWNNRTVAGHGVIATRGGQVITPPSPIGAMRNRHRHDKDVIIESRSGHGSNDIMLYKRN
jgi:hypothetical protein